MKSLDIVMIGAGNVANHLSKAFVCVGHHIIQVYSKHIENAENLAKNYKCEAISDLEQIENQADLYVIAISDNAIEKVLEMINIDNKNVIHTSGSVSISVFKNISANFGVFYPFQTFTKNRNVDIKNIPICIEANNEPFQHFLHELGRQISSNVFNLNSETRMFLHLAGIFANNFVNHLYSISKEILEQKGIPGEIINELIKETAAKALQMNTTQAQTGPARRNDTEIIKKHLDLLSSKPNLKQLYELLSKDIGLKYK
jgi:predicted short-subunit dehydrogenase-like oxidoreductase (DUF2520 family)